MDALKSKRAGGGKKKKNKNFTHVQLSSIIYERKIGGREEGSGREIRGEGGSSTKREQGNQRERGCRGCAREWKNDREKRVRQYEVGAGKREKKNWSMKKFVRNSQVPRIVWRFSVIEWTSRTMLYAPLVVLDESLLKASVLEILFLKAHKILFPKSAQKMYFGEFPTKKMCMGKK